MKARVVEAAQPQDRSAHVALRSTVNSYGDEAAKGLYLAFDWMNATYFEGKLGAPMILISPASSPRALGDYIPRDVHGLSSRIRIAPGVFRLGMLEALVTLLHEMIHAWCTEILKDTESGYKGHGPKFTAKANEIGAQLGYVKVYVKGRGGPDSRMWPYVVPEKVKAPKEAAPETEPTEPAEPTTESDDQGDDDASEAADWRRRYYEAQEEFEELRTERDNLAESCEVRERREHSARRDAQRERGLRVSLEMKVLDALHETRGQLEALKMNGRTSGGAPAQLRALLKVLEGLGVESSDGAESDEADEESADE